MALFNAPRALASDPNAPVALGRPPEYLGGWLPLVFSAVIAAAILVVFYALFFTPPHVSQFGATVQTISPSPTDTAVVSPMPSPITEPPPTQGPIQ